MMYGFSPPGEYLNEIVSFQPLCQPQQQNSNSWLQDLRTALDTVHTPLMPSQGKVAVAGTACSTGNAPDLDGAIQGARAENIRVLKVVPVVRVLKKLGVS